VDRSGAAPGSGPGAHTRSTASSPQPKGGGRQFSGTEDKTLALQRLGESPLTVRPQLARTLGLAESIVVAQLHHWLQKNREAERNLDSDGEVWAFNSLEQWQRFHFPFMSTRTLRRIFKRLESVGILVAKPVHGAKSYRLDLERLGAVIREIEDRQARDGDGQSGRATVATLAAHRGQSGRTYKRGNTREANRVPFSKNGRGAQNAPRDRKRAPDVDESDDELMRRARDPKKRRPATAEDDEPAGEQLVQEALSAEDWTELQRQEERVAQWNASLPRAEWVKTGPNEWRAKGSRSG
jgi:hypothetical protein